MGDGEREKLEKSRRKSWRKVEGKVGEKLEKSWRKVGEKVGEKLEKSWRNILSFPYIRIRII